MFRLPTTSERVAVMGSTGSGKTQFGFWLLSVAPFTRQPYIIIDYKRDELLNASDRIREIAIGEIPKAPGLYIVHPRPETDDVAIESHLEKIWERENTGVFFDEGYMVPGKAAFPAILTQGRSKHIPAIILTQRPAWISRFVFSEASHYAIFHLQDEDDRKTVRRFMPDNMRRRGDIIRLPRFHSWWYSVGDDAAVPMRPVPDAETLLDRIDDRLSPKRRAI